MLQTYRFELTKTNLQAVLAHHAHRNGVPAAAIVVNPKWAETTRALAGELGLAITVKGVGGCLIREIWLEVETS